ncbi:hypothetical protein CLOM_g14349 [Closterium sp. NIES-68]|nr:hypothetical protein CLOM_g14349 [Closterium sp. NIES-68]GJP61664.1 hypothetical protein CLOP_g18814 [Closterium sp. NIES-67]
MIAAASPVLPKRVAAIIASPRANDPPTRFRRSTRSSFPRLAFPPPVVASRLAVRRRRRPTQPSLSAARAPRERLSFALRRTRDPSGFHYYEFGFAPPKASLRLFVQNNPGRSRNSRDSVS